MIQDLLNQYVYDPEGRLCAVKSILATTATQYVYDASGARVAKGSISTWPAQGATCAAPTAANGFSLAAQYLLGPGGEQVTELSGNGTWKHSNVWAGANLDATYDPSGLHFHLADPLGTRRVQASALGLVEENCLSLPFGNGENCIVPPTAPSTADDATEHHFTGKERDTESGNDYFGARYYASSMGRFLGPDPGPFIWQDPQTLNRYAYARNNPLKFVDPNGQYFVIRSGDQNAKQAISMMLRSQTGRALVNSIAADPRPTYVMSGRLEHGNGSFTVGKHDILEINQGGVGEMIGTVVTIDSKNAKAAKGNKSLFYMLLKAYAHELSHVEDANAAPSYGAAVEAACMGDGNNCQPTNDTTHGTAEALALKILGELGDPSSFTPDAAADAETNGIIEEGNDAQCETPTYRSSHGRSALDIMSDAADDAKWNKEHPNNQQ
ncbi:MAG: RHS repeat-associated core domain-containing protein [Terracidiphilus sp.]